MKKIMRVFRLEHKEFGVGPYNGRKQLPADIEKKFSPIFNNCFASAKPNSDSILTCWEPFTRNPNSFSKQMLPRDILFGVKSLKALFDWFNRPYVKFKNLSFTFFGACHDGQEETDDTILSVLKRIGYRISVYEVDESDCFIEPSPGVQVAFNKQKAKRIY